MAHHNRTPRSVLTAPKSVPVVIDYRTAGYTVDQNGAIHRTTTRRGRKVRRHRVGGVS